MLTLYKAYLKKGRRASQIFKAEDAIDYLFYKYSIRSLYEKKLICRLPEIFSERCVFPDLKQVVQPFRLEITRNGIKEARRLSEKFLPKN